MEEGPAEHSRRRQPTIAVGALVSVLLPVLAACRSQDGSRPQSSTTLRMGVSAGQMATTNPQSGIRLVGQNQSVEGLARISDDGRPTPSLAQSWEFTPDGRTLQVHLRPNVAFHDGSAVTATAVVSVL